ncbi:MAG TPA: DUF948 domain-containing protein [Verrucomicrobiae bacterium]|nr:DUF948 domain-containing protein [Verrucomicrobiae bacterium]
MGMALQIALFLASVSIVVFVVLLMPVLLGLRRHLADAVREFAELRTDVKLLVQDSRTMVQNVNKLTTRVQQQIDEVDQMLQILCGWVGRADRLVHQAGDLIEDPIFTGARILDGLGALLQPWLTRDRGASHKSSLTSKTRN